MRITLLTLIFLSGCSIVSNFDSRVFKKKTPQSKEPQPVQLRTGIEAVVYHADIPSNIQTNPSQFDSSVSTTTEIENRYYPDLRPYIGLQCNFNSQPTRFWVAADVAVSYLALHDGYRQGIFDTKGEPVGGESYGFSQLSIGPLFIPMVGMTHKGEEVTLIVDVGAPYTTFDFRSGNDSYSDFHTRRKDSDSLVGVKADISVLFEKDEFMLYGFKIGYERYEPEFLGEESVVEGLSLSILISYGF